MDRILLLLLIGTQAFGTTAAPIAGRLYDPEIEIHAVSGATASSLSAGQSSSIQARITNACDGAHPSRAVLPFGTYVLPSSLLIPNHCTVEGQGQLKTILRLPAGVAGIVAATASPADIHLRDFTVDGNGSMNATQVGISITGNSTTDVIVERVTASNLGAYGIQVTAGAPGNRVRIQNCKVLNAGLSGLADMYGILFTGISDAKIMGNEISGDGVVMAIVSWNAPDANSVRAIRNLEVSANHIHDIGATRGIGGGGIDIGRAANVFVHNNTVHNVSDGEAITLESVWSGVVSGNTISGPIIASHSSIVLKRPDTTHAGEVGNTAISIINNAIDQTSGAGMITINGGVQGVTIDHNTLLTKTRSGISGIFLQLTDTDQNMMASGWGIGRAITISNNTMLNRAALRGNRSQAIHVAQLDSSQTVDQIIVSGNTARGWNYGLYYAAASAANGITNLRAFSNMFLPGNNAAIGGDGKKYSSVFYEGAQAH